MIEIRLTELRVLPEPSTIAAGVETAFSWVRVPGYAQTTAVLNGFSRLILDVFGHEVGRQARTAIGVAALPLNLPVVVAVELCCSPAEA